MSAFISRHSREHLYAVRQQQYYRKLRRSFYDWSCEALEPRGEVPARHHKLIIETLERVARGEVTRQMIFSYPGSAKSTYSSKLYPEWFMAQRIGMDVIGGSHTASLAEGFSREAMDYTRRYAAELGYTVRSGDAGWWRTTNRSQYRAAGVDGTITGHRADLVLIDDPVPGRKEAESQTYRDTCWNWYRAEVLTRMKPGARVILIMTRWHMDDLAGRLLDAAAAGEGDKWDVLSLPAICDSTDDPLGRAIGEPLWPEYHPLEWLNEKKRALGPYDWSALYQQKPRPHGGAFFEESDLLVGSEGVPLPIPTDQVYTIIDTNVKSGQQHDGLAVAHFALSPYQTYRIIILDWDICQLHAGLHISWLPGVLARGEELARMTRARRGYAGALIEEKNAASTLIWQGQQQGWAVNAINSKLSSMGKAERAIDASGHIRAGYVKISAHAYEKHTVYKGRMANHMIEQILNFRIGDKSQDSDDLLDTFTYGVILGLGSGEGV